jgi:hypothetical protein
MKEKAMPDVAVITIGNSDDKLKQAEWSQFVSDVQDMVIYWHYPIYFHGLSVGSAPWQNACWVLDARDLVGETNAVHILQTELAKLAKRYKQDSIALTLGNTEMVKPVK